jgi:hypothetical protein
MDGVGREGNEVVVQVVTVTVVVALMGCMMLCSSSNAEASDTLLYGWLITDATTELC